MKQFKLNLDNIELSGAEFDISVELTKVFLKSEGIPDTLENFKVAHKAIMAGIKLERFIQSMPVDMRAELYATAQKNYDETIAKADKKNKCNITSTKFTS